MPPPPVSKGLRELLEQQKQQSALLKSQHEKETARAQEEGHKREAFQRQQQQLERQTLRAAQSQRTDKLLQEQKQKNDALKANYEQVRQQSQQMHRQDQERLREGQRVERFDLVDKQAQKLRELNKGFVQEKGAVEQFFKSAGRLYRLSPELAQKHIPQWGRLSKEMQDFLLRAHKEGRSEKEVLQLLELEQENKLREQREGHQRKRLSQSLQHRELWTQQSEIYRAFDRALGENFRKNRQALNREHDDEIRNKKKRDDAARQKQGQRHEKERALDADKQREERHQMRARHVREQEQTQQRHRSEHYDVVDREREERLRLREREGLARNNERLRQLQAERRQQFILSLPGRATHLMQSAAHIANVAQNPYLSASMRFEETARALPIIGQIAGAFLDLKNALTGVTASLAQLHMESKAATIVSEGYSKRVDLGTRTWFETKRAGARSAAYATRVKDLAQVFGPRLVAAAGKRQTYAGEREYQFESLRYDYKVQLANAGAEAEAARKATEAARRIVEGGGPDAFGSWGRAKLAKNDVEFFKREYNQAQTVSAAAPWDSKAKTREAQALLDLQQAQQRALVENRQLEKDLLRLQQARVTEAEKKRQLGQAQIDKLKTEQKILGIKEQEMTTAARTLGTMNPAQRQIALASLKMAMNMGDLGFLPPALLQYARQVAPGTVAKLAERSGLKTSEFKELQNLGAVDKGDLDQIRQKIDETKLQVGVELKLNEAQFSASVAKAIVDSLKPLIDQIHADVKLQVESMQRGMMQRNLH